VELVEKWQLWAAMMAQQVSGDLFQVMHAICHSDHVFDLEDTEAKELVLLL
jgi:hypothetical protein